MVERFFGYVATPKIQKQFLYIFTYTPNMNSNKETPQQVPEQFIKKNILKHLPIWKTAILDSKWTFALDKDSKILHVSEDTPYDNYNEDKFQKQSLFDKIKIQKIADQKYKLYIYETLEIIKQKKSKCEIKWEYCDQGDCLCEKKVSNFSFKESSIDKVKKKSWEEFWVIFEYDIESIEYANLAKKLIQNPQLILSTPTEYLKKSLSILIERDEFEICSAIRNHLQKQNTSQ